MHLVAVPVLIIVYVLVRWRFRRLTVLPDTGHDLAGVQRGRKRVIDAGSPGEPAAGRVASLRDWLNIPDRLMLRGSGLFQAHQIVFNVFTAVMVFLVTAFLADNRAATFATACYLVVTALPHSWSYSSVWGNAAGLFLLAGFMMTVIAKVFGSPLYGGLAGSCLAFGALFSGMLFAVVTVPLTLAVPMLTWPTMYRYRLSMDPISFAGLLAGAVLVTVVLTAVRSHLLRVKRSDIRAACLATGPFLRMTLPFWALSAAGLFVLPPGLGWMVAAWLAGLTAGALLSRALFPKNFLGLVPIAAVSAGVALDPLVFSAAPPINAYRIGALAVVAIWLFFCLISLWLHGWRMTERRSLEVVAAPFALDAVAGRACGEFITHRLKANCKVMNLTELSSIFFYAPNVVSVGPTAWLADETTDLPNTVSYVPDQHTPDVIVTDESRCPILLQADELLADITFARIIEGRYSVYVRDGVMAGTHGAADGGQADLAIVVVACNSVETTRRCLRSIARTVDVPYELVLVDNGSTDSIPELFAEIERARIVRFDENRGYSAGVNAGVAAAGPAELVLLLHNDVVLTEGCVGRLVDTLHRENAAAVGPQAVVARSPQRVPARPFRHIIDLETHAATVAATNRRRSLGTDSLGGFCLLVRKDAFDSVGGFDETFSHLLYSDIDFCRRLATRGVWLAVALDTFVLHRGAVGWVDRFRHGTDLDDMFRRSQHEFSARWQVVPELEPSDTLKAADLRARAGGLSGTDRLLDALRLLTEAARLAPADPVVYNHIGTVLWPAGRHEDAFANFLRAVEMNPGLEDAAANLRDAAGVLDRVEEVADRLHATQRILDLGLDL